MERDAEPVPTKSAEKPTPNPFMRRPGRRSEKRDQQISPRRGENFRPDQPDEPAPECKVNREINRQQKREAVEKKALIQIAERAEPAERAGEEDHSRQIAEQKIAQPSASQIFT